MNDKLIDDSLPLPDLSIVNFRGVKELSLPLLGRVTLLAGRNGVGKTTVLEAVEAYATRAKFTLLRGLLNRREEFSVALDEDGDNILEPDWGSLFYGRDKMQNGRLSIGPRRPQDQLTLEAVDLGELSDEEVTNLGRRFPESFLEGETHSLRATYQGDTWTVPAFFVRDQRTRTIAGDSKRRMREYGYRMQREESRLPTPMTCQDIGPGLISNFALARFWDKVALTDDESHAIQALNLIYSDEVERVTMIGDDAPSRRLGGRRAVVKLKGYDLPVPLRSLGDGALRLFGVALALANSRDGFLLIDEAENGIHYSVQQDFWRMVLRTARENKVQVIATTHSWDCVRGFAFAAAEDENAEGTLVRLERQDSGLRAVRYSEEDLKIAAEQEIEVR